MNDKRETVVRKTEDGRTAIDIPLPINDIGQSVSIVVDRGKGEEVHNEKG